MSRSLTHIEVELCSVSAQVVVAWYVTCAVSLDSTLESMTLLADQETKLLLSSCVLVLTAASSHCQHVMHYVY
jgi:hypothetical protein